MPISTKERIIDASIDLFSVNGYAETTIRDIANKVGVKTSSLYYYFESKEAILNYIINMHMEFVNEDRHRKKWYDEKDSIITTDTEISVDNIMDYLFFRFDEQHDEQYRKIIKIICSEAVRNKDVGDFQCKSVSSSFSYIKLVLDTLSEAGKIPKHDTVKMAGVLYSIAFSFMHLSSLNMNHLDEEYEDSSMFSLIKYVLKVFVEGI